jgi:SAM-dependent methyltransferase
VQGYDPAAYGERWAEVYDDWYPPLADDDPMVERLVELAGPGPVLELGIGTGRVALALARRGVDVHGIDASPAMVERLRAKPGGRDIPVTMGDYAGMPVDGTYSLVFAVFNVLFSLPSQEAQLRCFANVTRRLAPGGAFLVEAFMPDPTRLDLLAPVICRQVKADEVVLNVSRPDLATQRIDASVMLVRESGVRLYPVPIRYAWPAELDLMARLAGLRLRERWGGWRREPFTGDEPLPVSVYEHAAAGEQPPVEESASTT